ncbi:MAG: hypothetical protein SPI86_01085 [Treponemataceae bacterium]|nr:hypothetical protein [Spirochaetales bacterium]MDY6030334.1 hypothetical protein [Treponemataceae bacterium]
MENHSAASDPEAHFDRTVTLSQKEKEIEYGIIDGNNIIVFIKAGLEGSCYGYENKYVRIGRMLNEKHGCSIIASSNPLGYKTDFAAEMDFIKDYAKKQNFNDYQVYFFGHSNGAALGIINAYQFAEIKKLVCINAPLMINPHLLLRGIKGFSGEKMTLVYGSHDASFDMLKLYSELESDKIDFVRIHGADHNFTGCLDLFIELPGIFLFGDELTYKGSKVC